MLTLLTVIHMFVAIILILFVLWQDPKGGGAMGVFGGGSSSSSVFGSTGAGNFLTTVTKTAAIIFAVSCVGLTYLVSRNTGSVVDNLPVPTAVEAPASGTEGEAAGGAVAPSGDAAAPTEQTPNPSK